VLYESESGDLRVALTGETMISRPLRQYREPAFLALRDLLHSADVRFTNAETLFHSYENPAGHLHLTYMSSHPSMLDELKWLGINLLACANNHSHDYGEGGVLTNLQHLADAQIAHAGTGANYAEALAPAYLETPRGRVALVAATSTSQPHARAGEQRRDMIGRPGANVIRWVSEWSVDAPALAELRRVADALGWRQEPPAWWRRDYDVATDTVDDAVYLTDRNALGQPSHVTEDPVARFVAGETFGHRGRWHGPDRTANLASVAEARRMADWVIFSIHNHEGGDTVDEPAQHIRELAHDVIDAGADIVVGHGPHRDRGIEI
jgi:poly-gamma-glutamate synthesis protein (capsule biosynthesis protein)